MIVGGLLNSDGRLGRSWKDGRATGQGVLEDYSHLAEGLLALYEATFDERWFTTGRALMDRVLDHFADPAGGFYDTADDHERLVTRPKDLQDNAVPSGNGMAVTVLLRLAAWTGDEKGLVLGPSIVPTVVAALESGKHVILTGPPGTAKTTLAELVAEAATVRVSAKTTSA